MGNFLKLNVVISLPNTAVNKKSASTNHMGEYPDLKKFVAEFENAFPHMRLVNVALEPKAGDENLTFCADVVTHLQPESLK